MVSVNPLTREIFLKIVYYGPGLGGKTTTLQYIHDTTDPNHRGKMVSLATPVERTLYFDYLPVRLPEIGGYALKLQLYTVPGQIHFNATRKLVLSNADGVVFVADSQRSRLEANLESFDNLLFNLTDYKVDVDTFPIVFNYNKRDLKDIISMDELERELNRKGRPALGTCAIKGTNVYEGLEIITKEVIRSVKKKGVTSAAEKPPSRTPKSVSRSASTPVFSKASYKPSTKPDMRKSSRPLPGPLPLEDAVAKITDTPGFDKKETVTAAVDNKDTVGPTFDNKDTVGPTFDNKDTVGPIEPFVDMAADFSAPVDPSPDRPTIPAPFALSEKAGADPLKPHLTQPFRNVAQGTGTPARFTFVPLWPESARKRGMEIETAISERRYLDAVRLILSEVEVIIAVHRRGTRSPSIETVIAMLGLEGAQYRDIHAAAAAPAAAITLKTVLNAYLFLLQVIDKSR